MINIVLQSDKILMKHDITKTKLILIDDNLTKVPHRGPLLPSNSFLTILFSKKIIFKTDVYKVTFPTKS